MLPPYAVPAGTHTSVRPLRWASRLAAALVLAMCAWLLFPGGAAQASPVSGGWTQAAGLTGNNYFVGQHRSNAGRIAYCTDFKKLAPSYAGGYDEGHSGGFIRRDGQPLDDSGNAALSYLLNRWGATSDDRTAAAVQLAVWAMTSPGMAWGAAGMNAMVEEENLPEDVIRNAKWMTEESRSNAGPYTIRIELGDGREAGLIAQAGISVLGSAGTPVSGLAVQAHVSEAFAFDEGRRSVRWTSGTKPRVIDLKRTTLDSGQLSVTVSDTPAAGVRWLEPDRPDVQRLLTAAVLKPRKATAALAALPAFQPTVTTHTSAQTAEAGSQLHDVLTIGVAKTESNPLDRWLHQPVTGKPLSVEVVSTLWGPLPVKPGPSSTVPAGTPKAGTVTTRVSGPGEYRTPSLTVRTPGYYVWTESISPRSTKPESASAFVKPWQGKFGIAEETTLVPWEVGISTALSRNEATVGDVVTDEVTLTGLPPTSSGGDDIELTMYGPLEQRPDRSAEIPEAAPVFATSTVPIANGTHQSGRFGPFTEAGCYTTVAHYPGDARTLSFTSAYGLADETVCVTADVEPAVDVEPATSGQELPAHTAAVPARPNPAPAPAPAPSAASQPAERQHLAETGFSSPTIAAVGVITLGLGLACGILTWRRRA